MATFIRQSREVVYAVSGVDRLPAKLKGNFFKPDTVWVEKREGQPVTVEAKGQLILHHTGALSRMRGGIIYGPGGLPMDEAPAWVGELLNESGIVE